jgi:hypothetical protein
VFVDHIEIIVIRGCSTVGTNQDRLLQKNQRACRKLHCAKRGCVQEHEREQGMSETKEERKRTHIVLFKNRVKAVSVLMQPHVATIIRTVLLREMQTDI